MIKAPSKLINFAAIPSMHDHSDDTCFRGQERDNDRYLIDIKDRHKKASFNYVCKYASLYTRKCIAPHKSPDQPAASARP